MSKILVTGAHGFLGRHLLRILKEKGYECVAVAHGDMEITSLDSVMSTVALYKPDYVVHCAAISATGYCAEHPDESYSVNAEGPRNVALACREYGAKLIFMSSDQVYAGCTIWGPLSENLELSPSNIYGSDKLKMEAMVLGVLPSAIGLRLTWMFEKYNAEHPHTDIMSRFHSMASSDEVMKASTRELRGISDVDEVCSNIAELIERDVPGGIYNFGAENDLVTYETMRRVAPQHGIDASRIIADDSWGRNLSMDSSKLYSLGITFKTTLESLSNNN